MSASSQFTSERFREVAVDRLSFLEGSGFRRVLNLEETTPTSTTVVYLGHYVGFIFSLDVRDKTVDADVVRVKDGQILPMWEGGYSSDLFGHLVTHEGHRGTAGSGDPANRSLESMIAAWAEVLRDAGQTLLSDRPDSLPGSATSR